MNARILTAIFVTALNTSAIWSFFVFDMSADNGIMALPVMCLVITGVVLLIIFIGYVMDNWNE